MKQHKFEELSDSFLNELHTLEDKYCSNGLLWKEIAKVTFVFAIMLTFKHLGPNQDGLDFIKNTVIEITRSYKDIKGDV